MRFGRRRRAKSFVVCGMPRSGTTFLTGLLESTARVGLAREYFSPDEEPEGAQSEYAAFVAHTIAAKSVHGIFGAKFVGNQLWDFLARLRSLSGNERLPDRALLEQVFSQPRFIWVTRRDVVAQAVSWWKAHQTGQWWSGDRDDGGASPVFDFGEIDRLLIEIERGNEVWEQWFADTEIEPFRVAYEELVLNRAEVTRQALEFLELDTDGVVVEQRTEKQADGINEEWIARYRALASSRDREA